MIPDLQELHTGLVALVHIVRNRWRSDDPSYAQPPRASEPGVTHQNFHAAHTCQHLSKQCGKLSGLLEPLAHGKSLSEADRREVSRQCAYVLIDVARLLQVVTVSADDVADCVRDWMEGREAQ